MGLGTLGLAGGRFTVAVAVAVASCMQLHAVARSGSLVQRVRSGDTPDTGPARHARRQPALAWPHQLHQLQPPNSCINCQQLSHQPTAAAGAGCQAVASLLLHAAEADAWKTCGEHYDMCAFHVIQKHSITSIRVLTFKSDYLVKPMLLS